MSSSDYAHHRAHWRMIAFSAVLAGLVVGEAIANSNPNSTPVAADAALNVQALPGAIEPIAHPGDDARSAESVAVAALDPAERKTGAATLLFAPMLRTDEPFGRTSERAADGPVSTKWRGLEAEIAGERAVIARCRMQADDCPPAAQRFLSIVDTARTRSGRARIGQVNRAVNLAIRPMSDLHQHGVADRWSAPLATLSSGRGDCEDYAIAKYVALREVGMPNEDLRLVIVRNHATNEDHAVLAVRHEQRWLILDNRHLLLLEDKDLVKFEPLFVMDHGGVQWVTRTDARRPREARVPIRVE
jgi:predicted transglutaminase-like cysteine proteinase